MEFPFITKQPGPEGTYPRNLFFSPESKTAEARLKRTPGLVAKVTPKHAEGRGAIVCRGLLYVVLGDTLFSINTSFVATSIGTGISGTGPVSMAKSGAYICISNGESFWYYKYSTGGTLTKVGTSSTGFQGASTVTYQDNYFICSDPNSDLYYTTTDPTSWSITNQGEPGQKADHIQAILSNEGLIAIFGEETIEWAFNSGETFPFARVSGATQEIGTLSPHSLAILDKGIFFLDSEGRICRTAGNAYGVISTPEIERRIKKYTWESAIGQGIYWDGHAWYILTFPDDDDTIVYDASTESWFEWSSGINGEMHMAPFFIRFGRDICAIGYETGKIYVLDNTVYQDDGTDVRLERVGPAVFSEGKHIRHDLFELRMKTGIGPVDGSDPLSMLSYSEDHMETWYNEMVSSLGKIGERSTLSSWDTLGTSKHRIYKWACVTNGPMEIYGSYLDAMVGRT